MTDLSRFSRVKFLIDELWYEVPSNRMLSEILALLPPESVENFWSWHEKTIGVLQTEGHPFYAFISVAENQLCNLLGYPMRSSKRLTAIDTYCKALFLKKLTTFFKSRKKAETASRTINIFILTGRTESEKSEDSYHPEMLQISEYRIAQEQLWGFWGAVLASIENPIIQSLVRERNQRLVDLSENFTKPRFIKESGRKIHYICPFCKKLDFFERKVGRKMPATCGSDACKNKYEVNKPSKKARSRKPQGWLLARRGNGIRCRQCRKRKRELDIENLCSWCFGANLEIKINSGDKLLPPKN